MPSSDQPARTDTGGLSGAHAAQAAEVAQLRKSMIQHLSASGKLLQAVFAIDRDYFGSRFQGGQNEGASTPFRDIEIATRVIETLGEELQGAAAFADSPALRDGIATLVASVDSVRQALIEVEKASLGAVGLPTNKVEFAARTFPDNNPLACLAEAAGFNREVQAAVTRLADRIQALRLLLQEAERARADAEDTVHEVKADEVQKTLAEEIRSRDRELEGLRRQARELAEQLAEAQRAYVAELEQLQGEIDHEAQARRDDVAEVRSLAAEVLRLVGEAEAEARRDSLDADDLVITASVLKDALADGQNLTAMATAAEAALLEWAKYLQRRDAGRTPRAAGGGDAADLARARDEGTRLRQTIAALERQVADATARIAQVEDEAQRHLRAVEQARADHARERRRAEDALTALAEAADAGQTASRLGTELTQAQERLRSAQAERDQLVAQLTEAKSQADANRSASVDRERLGGELAQARKELAQATDRVKALTAERDRLAADLARARSLADESREQADQARAAAEQGRIQAEQARSREQQAHADMVKARDAHTAAAAQLSQAAAERSAMARERDHSRAMLDEQRRTQAQAAEKATKEQQELQAQLLAAKDQVVEARAQHQAALKERDELKARFEEQRRATDLLRSQSDEQQGSLGKELLALRSSETNLRSQLATANAEAGRLKNRLDQAERELTQGREQTASRARELAKSVEQLQQEQIKRGALESELATLKVRLGHLEQEAKQAREQVVAARAAQEAVAAERTMWHQQRAELQAQLESHKMVATATAGERDRLRRELERVQGEHTTLAGSIDERESQLTARMTETSRQLGELKQANARLAADNERLVAQARELESAKSQASESAREATGTWRRRAEDGATALAEARARADVLERRLDEQRRRVQELEQERGRREQAEVTLRGKLTDLERRIADGIASGDGSDLVRERLKSLDAEVATLRAAAAAHEQRLAEMKRLLQDARTAVIEAKRRQQESDAADRVIIADLMRQVQAAKGGVRGAP